MKTRRFDFAYSPLQLNISFVVESGVPNRQNYDADTDEYTPDYRLVPLIIQPVVGCLDKDGVLSAGSLNAQLANVKWYEIVAGSEATLIDSTNTAYEITQTGADAGRIKVKKNAQPRVPVTLEFHAEYLDTRTGQIYNVMGTYSYSCSNATAYIPVLTLDAADQTIYNPLSDPDEQTVHASLRLGSSECPATNCIFVWEILRDDGTWTEAGSDTVLDYHIVISDAGATCKVNRVLMGDELTLRCRARYDVGGNPSSVTLNDASPAKVITFTRRLPKYEYDIVGVPTNISPDILTISPEATVSDARGTIASPRRALLPLWYIATNTRIGSPVYTQVGHGMTPSVPTRALDPNLGAILALDLKDAGPLGVLMDSDGKVLEDGDGNLVLIQ